MKNDNNIFGDGLLYDELDLIGDIYITCCACMSIYAEALSWANSHRNRIVTTPEEANAIIVLSCQVTDLAILNDIKTMEYLMVRYPGRCYYIGGCLARRYDIDLPAGVKRLDSIRMDYTPISNKSLVRFEPPFWVPGFMDSEHELAAGNIFRNMYPLRIGVGCSRKCSYCTISVTRGKAYELDHNVLEGEFRFHDDILLIADSPSTQQLRMMIEMAKKFNKKISIRNVEPHITKEITEDLFDLSRMGLLKIYHSPIQSTRRSVLAGMNRDPEIPILNAFNLQGTRQHGTLLATNIIIDYKDFPNPDETWLKSNFDYISWNPYWDGKWDRKIAEDRFTKYIGAAS